MPNSDATINRLKILKRAFRRIGKFTYSVTEMANAVELLNDIIKDIDSSGRWLWCVSNTPSTLTLVTNQRSYASGTGASNIATNILALERVELVQGGSYTPLTIIDKTESISTILRENTGQPTHVFLENMPSMTSQKMHFFQTPNSAYSIQYYFRRRLYDFDNASDNPDFPQDWAQRLVKIMSYELSMEYGLPLQDIDYLRSQAEDARNKGLASNGEEPTPTVTETVYY